MARYKCIDTHPRLLALDLSRQLLPETFEHALNHLLDHAIDLSHLDARFQNDATGAPAYPPALLLKIVLFAYSQGIVSSRQIERVCQEHVTFIVLCGDRAPHALRPHLLANRRFTHTARTAVQFFNAIIDSRAQTCRENDLSYNLNARVLLRGPSIKCGQRA